MARNPIAYNSGELAQLQSEPAVRPWRDAERVFIEPNLSAMVAGIKPTIQPRLRKKINLRPYLGVEKQGQTRIEKVVDAAVDEPGRVAAQNCKLRGQWCRLSARENCLERQQPSARHQDDRTIHRSQGWRVTGEKTKAQRGHQLHKHYLVVTGTAFAM